MRNAARFLRTSHKPKKTLVIRARTKIIIMGENPKAARERVPKLIRPQQLAATAMSIYDRMFLFMGVIIVSRKAWFLACLSAENQRIK